MEKTALVNERSLHVPRQHKEVRCGNNREAQTPPVREPEKGNRGERRQERRAMRINHQVPVIKRS